MGIPGFPSLRLHPIIVNHSSNQKSPFLQSYSRPINRKRRRRKKRSSFLPNQNAWNEGTLGVHSNETHSTPSKPRSKNTKKKRKGKPQWTRGCEPDGVEAQIHGVDPRSATDRNAVSGEAVEKEEEISNPCASPRVAKSATMNATHANIIAAPLQKARKPSNPSTRCVTSVGDSRPRFCKRIRGCGFFRDLLRTVSQTDLPSTN